MTAPENGKPEIKENPQINGKEEGKADEDLVTPWDVKATTDKGVDYDKLIGKALFLFKFLGTFLQFDC